MEMVTGGEGKRTCLKVEFDQSRPAYVISMKDRKTTIGSITPEFRWRSASRSRRTSGFELPVSNYHFNRKQKLYTVMKKFMDSLDKTPTTRLLDNSSRSSTASHGLNYQSYPSPSGTANGDCASADGRASPASSLRSENGDGKKAAEERVGQNGFRGSGGIVEREVPSNPGHVDGWPTSFTVHAQLLWKRKAVDFLAGRLFFCFCGEKMEVRREQTENSL